MGLPLYQVASSSIQPFGHNRHGRKVGGLLCSFLGGAGSSITMSPGPRPTSVPGCTLIDPAIWPQHIWAKNCGAQPSFWEGELGPHLAQCGLDRGPLPCQCHLDLTRRLATIDMGRKLGAPPPFWGGGWVPMIPYNTKSPGPRPTSIPSGILIHPAIWPQQIWAKIGGCALLREGELGPHLTQCGHAEAYLHAKFHLHPSNRLATIHQYHRQTDRQDRQRSDSIGRTFLK